MVFDEGVQIFVGSKVYQTTFRYDTLEGPDRGPIYSADCTSTLLGWAHDTTEEGHLILDPTQDNWNCFMMDRWDEPKDQSFYYEDAFGNRLDENYEIMDEENLGPIVNDLGTREIKKEKKEAGDKVHQEDLENIEEKKTIVAEGDLLKFLDTDIDEIEDTIENLPSHWDWRNINGVNYVPDIVDQA